MIGKPLKFILAAIALLVLSMGCTQSPSGIKKALEEDPDIIFGILEKHPDKFAAAFQKAQMEAQRRSRDEAIKREEEQMDAEYKNPKEPLVEASRAVRGKADGLLIVEYSDFECPYCRRGADTVEALREDYGDKVRFMFKHLPLSFHPNAMPAAKRFEAIAIQSKEAAYKFHDEVFKNQNRLKDEGEKFLDEAAKKAGANVAKMKKDMESEKVKQVIEADMAEARKFGISGTPGFIVGGITVKGARPPAYFKKIIDRRLKELGKG